MQNDPNSWYQGPPPPLRSYDPNSKKKIPLWLLFFIPGMLLVCICSFSVLFANHSTPQTSSQIEQIQNSNVSTPKPTATPKWHTIQTFSASGTKKTAAFSVPDQWKIVWSCNPASDFSGSYNVMIEIYNSDTTPYDLVAINEICKTGTTSGETIERGSGNVYLDIDTGGSLTIKIEALS